MARQSGKSRSIGSYYCAANSVGSFFVMFVIAGLFKLSVGLVFGVAVLLVIVMILSRQLKRQSIMMNVLFSEFAVAGYACGIFGREEA